MGPVVNVRDKRKGNDQNDGLLYQSFLSCLIGSGGYQGKESIHL